MNCASTTVSEREFEGSVTLREKAVFLTFIFDLWVNSFSV